MLEARREEQRRIENIVGERRGERIENIVEERREEQRVGQRRYQRRERWVEDRGESIWEERKDSRG